MYFTSSRPIRGVNRKTINNDLDELLAIGMILIEKILLIYCGKPGFKWLFFKAKDESEYSKGEEIHFATNLIARVEI